MRFAICLLLFISFSAVAQQDSITTYFTEDWKPCEKELAFFARKVIQTNDKLWLIRDYTQQDYKLNKQGHALDKDANQKTGQWYSYYDNGAIASEGGFQNGKRQGKWLFHHQNGKLASLEFYSFDSLTKVKCWRENGEPDTTCYPDDFPPTYSEDLYSFIAKHINYPILCREADIQGRVIITFSVDEEGNAKDFSIVPQPTMPCSLEFETEALRVVSMLKKWTPAVSHNRKRKIHYTIPVLFKLN